MKRTATQKVLGAFIVITGLAISGTASAQVRWGRWQNANYAQGLFYLGVSGGESCLGPGGPCGVTAGTQIITYQLSQLDQRWGAAREFSPPAPLTTVQDYFTDYAGAPMCLAVAANSKSLDTNLVVWECQSESQGPGQYWKIVKAEDFGATTYAGCFVFVNQNSGMVMSVNGGW